MSVPRRPKDDPPDEELESDETLTDELLELPDDLDLEDPLAHLEAQLGDDEEEAEFEDEPTQPLEEVELTALESLDDEDEGDEEEEIEEEDRAETTLEYEDLLDEDSSMMTGVVLLHDEDEDEASSGLVPTPDEVVLPWQTEAVLPDLGLTLPAVLDPTMEQSFWMVAELGNQDRVDARVQLPGIQLQVTLVVRSGRKPGLRLGRDVLTGRILISC